MKFTRIKDRLNKRDENGENVMLLNVRPLLYIVGFGLSFASLFHVFGEFSLLASLFGLILIITGFILRFVVD